jgi:carboxylesterase
VARILLLHGLGGTGATMRLLADALSVNGHDVQAPTLPGHGSTVHQLAAVGWSDWMAAVATWPADVVVGQSMGAALALARAGAEPRSLKGVVAINPPQPDADVLEGLEWMSERGHQHVDAPPLADGESGYSSLPIIALIQMAKGVLSTDLGALAAPVLLVTSALDEVVDPATADGIARSLAASVPVTRLTLPNSGHVASLGPDHDLLVDAIDRFCAKVT